MSAPHPRMMNNFSGTPFRSPSYAAANALWKKSDFKQNDIKVAQIYDAFTTMVLLSFEAYGFCGIGEGAAFTENGALELGGRLALNTSGGSLSEAYVHGFNLINEGVRQMRGSSVNQVAEANACLVTSADDVPSGALILRN